MNKNEFLNELSKRLSGLGEEDIKKSVAYYNEIIEDSIEDGMSEEEAVASLGDIEQIVEQIYEATPLARIVKAKVKPSRTLRAWEIILLVLGSPLWLSLLIAFFAVVFSLYISVWAVIISMFVTVLALIITVFVLFCVLAALLFSKAFLQFAFLFGATLIVAGLTILLYLGSFYTAKGIVVLTKNIFKSIKKSFAKKGEK